MNQRIIIDSDVCGGEPCIKGTRIPVHVILSHLAAGEDYQTIFENFPRIKKEDILACLEYASYLFICLIVILLLNGCSATGLYVRENKTINYSSYLYGLYDEEFSKGNIQVVSDSEPVLKLPITLAVAQVGEYGPPQGLMDYLKSQTTLFKDVKGIPAISDTSSRESTAGIVKDQIHKR